MVDKPSEGLVDEDTPHDSKLIKRGLYFLFGRGRSQNKACTACGVRH